MEHGDDFVHCNQPAKSSSDSNLQQRNESPGNKGAPIPSNPNDEGPHRPLPKPNKNYDMPITTVTKIMQQAMPFNATVKDDAKALIQQCITKYISFICTKANERCQREYRKILKEEDLLWAVENLRFDDYVGPLGLFLYRFHRIEGNLSTESGGSIPINVGHVKNNGHVPGFGTTANLGPLNGHGPFSGQGPIYGPGLVFGSSAILEPVYGPVPVPEPTVGMAQASLPPPSIPFYGPGFSMDLNANLEMFDPRRA